MAVKQRKPRSQAGHPAAKKPSSPSLAPPVDSNMPLVDILRRQPLWIILAVASGACAALNGVFAKLTTTALTSTLSASISTFFHLPPNNTPIDLLVRLTFFGLNLAFNALMWALFTAALTRGDSTTRVSVVNVSANFMVTAVMGWIIFGEELKGLWWVGAGLLAVGNVVIGRRDESSGKKEGTSEAEASLLGEETEREGEGDLLELDGDVVHVDADDWSGEQRRLSKGEDADAPI
ncbi:uncharacterized protein AB675_10932 [Cyphellophora attinorum]|uniref:EamA domain-containing protein n=1 Tax=Cyphellophora attinorum TaxID=1664694 RepID=A0A0N0NI98_9EURO|nr:uncharacterized protein AB675_10932 [Phialophora attinorum]KPI35488.1 hypothetical protein AB675_10932 [Phialophora attinorum]